MLDEKLTMIFNKARENLVLSVNIGCSLDSVIIQVTSMFFSILRNNPNLWGWQGLGEDLFLQTKYFIARYNKYAEEDSLCYTRLLPLQIAYLINFQYCIRRIPCAGERGAVDSDLLAVYQTTGPDEGLYVENETTFRQIARYIKPTISNQEFAEVQQVLRDIAWRVERCQDRDLIPVNNGIFNYKTKELLPFNPNYVFLAKSRVNYNPQAQNLVIHNADDGTDWDVESWMHELSDDPEIVKLLWQVLGAILRPFVRWGKSPMLYGESGCNGKGTLCEMMRCLCGEGRYTSIPLENFGKNFMLEDLPNAMAVIVDENDVGGYLEKAGNLKAIITGDVVQINRKNKRAIPFQFFGLVVQCFNQMPKIRDRTDSIYRRCLFIPFDKSFTGQERTYIKNDYIHRPEVLEYVMYKVLNMDYYKLDEPVACARALGDYKIYNDPTRQWWEEVSSQLVWDLLPWKFLYELYKHWFEDYMPSGKPQSKNTFVDEMRRIVENDTIWMYPGKGVDGRDKQFSASNRIGLFEYLGKNYYMAGSDKYNPNRSLSILGDPKNWTGLQRGLLRRVPNPQAQQAQNQVQNQAQSVMNSNAYVAMATRDAVTGAYNVVMGGGTNS